MKTIRTRLTLLYSAITVATLLIIALFLNKSIDRMFEHYAKERQKSQIEYILNQIAEQYQEETGSFDMRGVEAIANAALQNGFTIHIQTANHEMDWDINTHKNRECNLMLQHSENNMHSRYPNFDGGYAEEKYDFTYGGNETGYVTIGYYGPYSLDDNELKLINDINNALLVLGVIFLAIVLFLTILISKSITRPITAAVTAAGRIANGEYGILINEQSGNEETQNLINAVNHMSMRLKDEEAQKRQITADVAHELRTPLSNLQGSFEAMLDGIWEPTRERLASCHEEIIRLTAIVSQLRALYALENKKERLYCQSIGFSDLCKSLSSDFAIELEKKKIKLTIHANPQDTLWGDEYKIRQCMVNLISNAIQYSREGKEVEICLCDEGNHMAVRVKDYGIGIPKEELPHLFERFYRVDKSRNAKTGGMGLGLSITKAIVESHGGTIAVESILGKETTFIMTFPKK